MRTGPFSDPALVTFINRYFVAFHMDNTTWSEPRYGFEPGEENAYIILETPETPGTAKDTVILNTLGVVLDPKNTREALEDFLGRHQDLHKPISEMARLESDDSDRSKLTRAELWIEEGRTTSGLSLLDSLSASSADANVLRARAYRSEGRYSEALAELNPLTGAHEDVEMERARIAFAQNEDSLAAGQLDALLSSNSNWKHGAEVHWLRGWLYYREGHDDRAIDVWTQGIDAYPPEQALFSQKAYFTMIRLNWEISDTVDQAYK